MKDAEARTVISAPVAPATTKQVNSTAPKADVQIERSRPTSRQLQSALEAGKCTQERVCGAGAGGFLSLPGIGDLFLPQAAGGVSAEASADSGSSFSTAA